MTTEQLPKFFKDSTGFCYTATPMLAREKHLTPWDGDIDEAGFAVEKAKPVATSKGSTKPTAE